LSNGLSDSRYRETEEQFDSRIIEYARWRGCLAYHQRPARMVDGRWRTALVGDKGFPDLVVARGGRCLFFETKVGTNKASLEQQRWLAALPNAYLVTPKDWPQICGLIDALASAVPALSD
jgi:hypothetical protein